MHLATVKDVHLAPSCKDGYPPHTHNVSQASQRRKSHNGGGRRWVMGSASPMTQVLADFQCHIGEGSGYNTAACQLLISCAAMINRGLTIVMPISFASAARRVRETAAAISGHCLQSQPPGTLSSAAVKDSPTGFRLLFLHFIQVGCVKRKPD